MRNIHPAIWLMFISTFFLVALFLLISPNSHSAENIQRLGIRSSIKNWPKTPSYHDVFNPLNPDIAVSPNGAAQTDQVGLIVDKSEHYELVEAYCSACHSLDIVVQQKASKARWNEILVWMTKTQGMTELPKDDFDAVLSYLSENYSN